MAWDKDKPADNEKIRDLGTVIRANWYAIEKAEDSFLPWAMNLLSRENTVPVADGAPADPTAVTDTMFLYVKGTGDNAQLYLEDANSSPNKIQMSRTDDFVDSSNGSTFLPGGLLLQWGTVAISASTVAVTFPVEFSADANVYNIQVSAIQTSTSSGNVHVVSGSVAKTGFTVGRSSASQRSAYWVAIGK